MLKTLILLIFLFSNLTFAGPLREVELDWSIYSSVEIEEYFATLEVERRAQILADIKTSKLSLFNGDVHGAIKLLKNILVKNSETPLKIIIDRYLALAHFTLGDFQSTLNYLSSRKFLTTDYYPQICILRVASLLHLKQTIELKEEMVRCQNTNIPYTTTNFRWFKYLSEELLVKRSPEQEYNYYKKLKLNVKRISENYQARAWLKYGLLFDQEDLVSENIHLLPDKSFQDEVNRTLMAYNLFMNGKDNKAKSFIEDINNSNAAYLKAVMETKSNKYKTALAHSTASNKRRPFSINNSQLMTALSWVNQKWKTGRMALSKVIPPDSLRREQKLLTTSFLIQEKNFYRAEREIEEIFFLYNKKMPFEALVIESYIFLTLKDYRWIKSSDTACIRYDGMNCWLHMQSLIWDDYAGSVKNFGKKRFKVLDKIKKLTTKKNLPKIRESNFIKQRDIIELDIAEDPLLEDI